MQVTVYPGLFPDFIGKRSVFVGVGTGPASYTTGVGDPVSVNINPFFIDSVTGGGILDTSGTYIATFYSKGTGVRQTWYARYIVASTGAEYTGGTALKSLVWNGVTGVGAQF
jgi:hypothetical protein